MEDNFTGDYSLAFMALDLLLRGQQDGGVGKLADHWREIGGGADPNAAFQKTFGKSLGQFYADFEAYRARGFR